MRRAIPWPIRPRPMKPTFMKSCSCQLPEHPFDLPAHIVDDVAGLQVIGQYVPGIGLNLKLTRQGFLFMHLQRFLESETCRTEGAQVVEEHRNMKVRAPFARARVRFA